MSTTPVDAVGLGTPVAAATISSAELLRIVFEASASAADGGDPLANIDMAALGRDEFKKLQDALLERDESLTRADKEAIEKGEPQQLKEILLKLHQQAQAAARGPEGARRPGDGFTQPRLLYQAEPEAAQRGLELGGDTNVKPLPHAQEAADAGAPQADRRGAEDRKRPAPDARSARGERVPLPRVSNPTTDKELLARGRQQVLALTVQSAAAPAAAADSERAARDKQRATIGETRPTYQFTTGFPAAGRSGEAHQMPLAQVLPERLRATLASVGIETLGHLLAAVQQPGARAILARLCGLPRTTMLLAGLRAELLNLPVDRKRTNFPHVKDAALLGRLGISSVHDLTLLDEAFHELPARMQVLTTMVSALQRQNPDMVGRRRIARLDLQLWAQAAQKRGSDLLVRPRTLPPQPPSLEKPLPGQPGARSVAAPTANLPANGVAAGAPRGRYFQPTPIPVAALKTGAADSPPAKPQPFQADSVTSKEQTARDASVLGGLLRAVLEQGEPAHTAALLAKVGITSPHDPTIAIEEKAEKVLAWYLSARHPSSEALWSNVVLSALTMMQRGGCAIDGNLMAELGMVTDAALLAALPSPPRAPAPLAGGKPTPGPGVLTRTADAAAARPRADEPRAADAPADTRDDDDDDAALYDGYVMRADATMLMADLLPQVAPAEARRDGLICFYMDPVPDFRHVLSAAEQGQRLPETMKPVYVCIDPASGAIIPQGS